MKARKCNFLGNTSRGRSAARCVSCHETSRLPFRADGKSPPSSCTYFLSLSPSMSFWGFHYKNDIFFFLSQRGSVFEVRSLASNYSRSFQRYCYQLQSFFSLQQFHFQSSVAMLMRLRFRPHSCSLQPAYKLGWARQDLWSWESFGWKLFWEGSHSLYWKRRWPCLNCQLPVSLQGKSSCVIG